VVKRRPPQIPHDVDEYDGHGDYRERLREVASFDPTVWVGVLLSFGMWYAAGRLALVLLDPGPDPDDFLAILVYLFLGTGGWIAYIIALALAKSTPAQRGVLAAGALTIAFAVFYPFARDHRLTPGPPLAGDGPGYERWLNELRTSARVAEPGVVPPIVSIRQRDGAVLVRNLTGHTLVLELALVQERTAPDGSREWQRCALSNAGGSYEGTSYRLAPLVAAWFEPHSHCEDSFGYAEVEFRIGVPGTPVAWSWRSSSALAAAAP
jgi:hypothetical protein